jgi:hypothetical protein
VLVLCKVGIVGWSAGGKCIGGRSSLLTGWREWERKVGARGESV